jgi:hypothetical protein
MRRLAILVALGLAAGCTANYHGRLRTRDPFELPKIETYRSGTIVVGQGDIDIVTPTGQRPPLLQGAWFEIVSENEIRFHVSLSHKWQEQADVRSYRVQLTTDHGHRLVPVEVYMRRAIDQTHEVTVGQVKPGVLQGSTPVVTEETIRRELHGADTVVTFRAPGIVSRQVRSYTLSLDGRQRRLRFTWDLVPRAELGDDE